MFFKQYPTSSFEFDGKTFTLEDLTRKVIFEPKAFSNFSYIYDIDISDSRPDVVSHLLYGNVNYWWTFFIINGITMNEWPMTDEELDDWMTERYTDFQLAQVKRYVTDEGEEVQEYGFPTFVADGKLINYAFQSENFLNGNLRMTKSRHNRQTLREYLTEHNDNRKKIKAVRAEFIGRFFDDFRKRIKAEVDLG
ncbi:putative base plate wedge component [Sinorhizobium phage phiM9]|uniref:Putative base plate wedge component n=1 Tax=Sinorhizobium phage phiM9 TaxID=1636182 RepID=A0A0F6TGZ0_9CAUD|nr:putative base plate wedge component [Sinorhizobium phage phiM9]AKE44641.1 putative base plate wedge component [Sinorhizobium phage phiM9]